MRKLVYDFLVAQGSLTTVVPSPSWFEEGAVVDTPSQRPFVIMKYTGTVRGVRPVTTLELWCYDERGDYTRIDQFLRQARASFDAMPESSRARTDGTVVRLVAADWQGDSADLYDDVFRCNVRSGSWRLIGAGQ